MKSKRWLVTATVSKQLEVEVTAKDRDEAKEKAEGLDGSFWQEASWIDACEITAVEEIRK